MDKAELKSFGKEIPGAYHAGSRQLQDHFDSRRIADRLESVTVHTTFTDADRAFINTRAMFFLATTDQEGWPDCSYKGGIPGFVRVVDGHSLAFPDYDGNGMFRSLEPEWKQMEEFCDALPKRAPPLP